MNQVILEATARALARSLRVQLESLHEDLCKYCYGCQVDHPSQRDHECLDYSSKRTYLIMEAVQLVDEKITTPDLYWNISVILAAKERKTDGNPISASEVFQFLFARPDAINLSFMKQNDKWCLNLIALVDSIAWRTY